MQGAVMVHTMIVTVISPVFEGEMPSDKDSASILRAAELIVPLSVQSMIEKYTPCASAIVTHKDVQFVTTNADTTLVL